MCNTINTDLKSKTPTITIDGEHLTLDELREKRPKSKLEYQLLNWIDRVIPKKNPEKDMLN
jgi:hypothetical protein